MKRVLLALPFVLAGCRDNVTAPAVATAHSRGHLTASACTSTCYVDAVHGNDLNGGASVADSKKTIQAALNQVSADGQVRVLPGTYNESAPASSPTTIVGTYQFGLFFTSAKPGITVVGVSAADIPVTSASATLATINTNATNNFGYDGIFVEAANTTIQGVTIGPNAPEDNKTIEIVADNFTLQYVKTAVPVGGSIYIDDFSTAGDVVKSYHIRNNAFTDGTSIDIASGAGLTGAVAGREIIGNTFDLAGNYWNAISFNGSDTGVPWFVLSVGGAVVTGNTFRNGALEYIRARGHYDNSQFNWASYWTDNSFDKAAIALVNSASFEVRSYSYEKNGFTFPNVRHIGTLIQPEVDKTASGNEVLAKGGVFAEQVSVGHSLTLKGAGAATTAIIAPSSLPDASQPMSNIVTILGSASVVVDISGFSISGPGPTGCGSIRTGIFVRDGAKAIIHENNITDIRDALVGGHLSGCQNGVGIAVGRDGWKTTGLAVITNNMITGFQKGGIVVDYVGSSASIDGNTVQGIGATPLIAQNGIQISRGASGSVTGNTIGGNNYTGPVWEACGLLFYDAAGVEQHGNKYSNNGRNLCNYGRGGGKATLLP